MRLHVGETAEPHQLDLLVHQRLDCGRIVVDRGEFDFHAELSLQVLHEGAELAQLLGGGFFRDGGDPKDLLRPDGRGHGEQRQNGNQRERTGQAAQE